ncbi:hypothetical protein BJX76DRAFT_335498 [Aspergillus varians]
MDASAQTAALTVRIRRSAVACTSCRRRKIRCDVTVRSPCTNCRLDNDRCVIVGPRRPQRPENTQRPREPAPLATGRVSVLNFPATVPRDELGHNVYPAVLSAELGWLPSHEVAYLTSSQALTLPKKTIIHTLLQSYFLHVHPCFPVVKESEFRESTLYQKPFSLLVFRAMLFAAASHIPTKCAQDAGYASIAHLRYSLYKTAKSLYDFRVEKDPFHIAQATLLLAYHFDNTDPMCNATWLAIAVQYMHRVKAYRDRLGPHNRVYSLSDLKRLWWCCALRDRILALVSRQPLVLTLDQFDPSRADYLGIDEVWDEYSNFFDIHIRAVLHRVLVSQCRLVSLLTPSVMSSPYLPDVVGPQVCIIKEMAMVRQAYTRLCSYKKHYEGLLGDKEVDGNLAVAVNVHLTSLFYIGACLTMLNRLAVLYLSSCRCTLSSPRISESAGREQYLNWLLPLVSETSEEVKWFAMNKVLHLLPISSRSITLLQHTLNILWLHLDNLDGDIPPTRDLLSYYTELDADCSTRFGFEPLSPILPHLVGLTVGIYDTSAGHSIEEYRTSLLQPCGTLNLSALSQAEIIRLANISLRLSVVIDSSLSTNEDYHATFDSLSSLLSRLDAHRQLNDCSGPSSASIFHRSTRRYDIESLQPTTAQSDGTTPSSPTGESQSSHYASSPRLDGGGASSLDRFGAATDISQPSMQEWAGELEEFMAPLFGL